MFSSHEQNPGNDDSKTKSGDTGRMPDFLIIGAMKSGTTSLFELLGKHPEIFVPAWKELQYFSRDHKFNLGERWYRDHFIDAREGQLIGEASTCYTRWPHYPHAVERIAERLPDIHLIYLMRHPVERSYSHYGHLMQERLVKKNGPLLTFEEALKEEKEIINASLYMVQIERYLPLFHRDQMLFLTLDELKSSPAALLQRTQDFLGINPINLTAEGEVKANQWGDSITCKRRSTFIQNIQRIPGLTEIIHAMPKDTRQRLKESFIHSKLFNSLLGTGLKEKRKLLSPLSHEIRERLLEQFEGPTKRLEDFLDMKLDSWHK